MAWVLREVPVGGHIEELVGGGFGRSLLRESSAQNGSCAAVVYVLRDGTFENEVWRH